MTIQEAAEPHIPKFMSGLMSRDYEKALSAMRAAATDYHAANGLETHKAAHDLKLPQQALIIVSAAMYACEGITVDG